MKKNIGLKDRILRLGIAVILLILSWTYESWILLLISLFTFIEVVFSWCAFYQLIGKNTCDIDKR
ncbi:MAG: DUF2892 domain-containing protein [Chlamydiia bacterium]|nr:DUF2892 domain-containing protein [Chlamydiia bacterium]